MFFRGVALFSCVVVLSLTSLDLVRIIWFLKLCRRFSWVWFVWMIR